MNKFLLPLLFLLLFILEGVFVEFMPSKYSDSMKLVPHFLLVAILLLSIFGSKKHGIIYGLVFGLLFDIVYTEVIGIYLFIYPLASYLASKMMRVLHANIVIASITTLLGVAFVEVGVYELNRIIHITDLTFIDFIQIRFIPTILLNLAFIIIVVYPLKRLFEKISEELGSD
ncbi:MAG: rod shape-determining protein MreD [Bacillota bacterium]|nr:rod shape-determining protein MreD [Bacillota bacterium]MDP4170813.1 rod shape-determining protein MreD [Bacillota bacterium]